MHNCLGLGTKNFIVLFLKSSALFLKSFGNYLILREQACKSCPTHIQDGTIEGHLCDITYPEGLTLKSDSSRSYGGAKKNLIFLENGFADYNEN